MKLASKKSAPVMTGRGGNGAAAPHTNVAPALTAAMKTALELLLEAHNTAAGCDRARWDFALEIHALTDGGLRYSDLRALVCQGLAEHRLERTRRGAACRTFQPPRGLRLHAGSCFVLSPMGLRLARAMPCAGRTTEHAPPDVGGAAAVPFWDGDRRELRLGDVVVKRFRQPARNQETILAAFQEDGWPTRIDNPLPPNGETDAEDRLHDGIKKLNRQTRCWVRFLSDGAGLGALWELATAGASAAAQERPRSGPYTPGSALI